MSTDDTDGTTRRAVLKKGALLGSALAMGAIGGAAGDTGDGAASASVGQVDPAIYKIAEPHFYGGPDSAKSTLSPDDERFYLAVDTQTWYDGNGSSWDDITPTSGGGSGVPRQLFDAIVYPDGSDVAYYDVSGRSGSTGLVSTYADAGEAQNAALEDYDGDVDGTRGGVIGLANGVYSWDVTVDFRQGTTVLGPAEFYRRSPSSGLSDFLAYVTDAGSADPLYRMQDAAVTNDAKGGNLIGVDMRGSGRGTGTTAVEMGTAGRTTVQNCSISNFGGNGIYANDSFSAHVLRCDLRDNGTYSTDGSGNENGTNNILTNVTDQNVNLLVGGTFAIEGPGAGVSNPASNIPSSIRTTSGASIQIQAIGGMRSGAKLYSGATDVAAIKGEDLKLLDLNITGENGAGNYGVWHKGGVLKMEGGQVEKMTDGVYIENIQQNTDNYMANVTLASMDADVTGGGNGIHVPSGSSGAPPAIHDCDANNLDRSFIRYDPSTGGRAYITGGEIQDVDANADGNGWIIEDNRGSTPNTNSLVNVRYESTPNGVTNDYANLGTHIGNADHTMLGNQVYTNAAAADLEPGEIAVDTDRGGTGNFALLYHDGTNVQYIDAGGTL